MNFSFIKKINIGTILGLLLVIVIGFEIYLGLTYLYPSLDPRSETVQSNNIVRVNRMTSAQITEFLDELYFFNPEPLDLAHPNPFKYSQ